METQKLEFVRKDYKSKGYSYFRPPVPIELAKQFGWKDGDRMEWVPDREGQCLILKKVN